MKLDLYRSVKHRDRGNVIVHIGTGPGVSIEAIRILRMRGHDVRLVVVGSSLGLPKAEGVEYRYAIPEKEKLELICRAKALIFPSISEEPFPYAVIEAVLLGTIPIVSRVCGVKELLDNTLAFAYMFTPGCVNESVEKTKGVCMLDRSKITTFSYELRTEIIKKFNPSKL